MRGLVDDDMKGKPTFQVVIRATLENTDDGFCSVIITNPIKIETPQFEEEIYRGLLSINLAILDIPDIQITPETYQSEIVYDLTGGDINIIIQHNTLYYTHL